MQKRIDLMCDIETLGKGYNPPIIQIACVPFDITTGEILDRMGFFNETCSIKDFHNIEGDTLNWWLNTDSELLKSLIAHSSATEKELIHDFDNYITKLKGSYMVFGDNNMLIVPEVYLWGNGILFDNRIIKEKFEHYGLKYPIGYRNDRDMRTLVEMACYKNGMEQAKYRKKFAIGTAHNALDDVRSQINTVVDAWKVVMN